MRCTKSTPIGRARLSTAIGPMADPRRAVPRRAASARALLLMATVLPVAPALSTASAAASVPPMVPDLCADKAPPMPSSTGAQVPAVNVQMQGAWLAPGSDRWRPTPAHAYAGQRRLVSTGGGPKSSRSMAAIPACRQALSRRRSTVTSGPPIASAIAA